MKNIKLKIKALITLIVICVLVSSMAAFAKKHDKNRHDEGKHKGNLYDVETLVVVEPETKEEVESKEHEESTTVKESEAVEESTTVVESITAEETTTLEESTTAEETTTVEESTTVEETTTVVETTKVEETTIVVEETTIIVEESKKKEDVKKGGVAVLNSDRYCINVGVKTSIKSLKRVYEIPNYINDSDLYDISEKLDKTVVAFVDNGCYCIYSSCEKIQFPKDSSGFFWQSQSMEHCDLSGFDFSKVDTLKDMFVNCFVLKEVIWPKDQTIKLKKKDAISGMFSACHSIESVDFRTFDLKDYNYSYAAFLGCTSLDYIYVDRKKANNNWRGKRRVLDFYLVDDEYVGTKLADSVDNGTYTLTSADVEGLTTVEIVDGSSYKCYLDKVVSSSKKYCKTQNVSKTEETTENISEAIIGSDGKTTFKITIERTYDKDGQYEEKPLTYAEELKNVKLGGPKSSIYKVKEDKLGPAKDKKDKEEELEKLESYDVDEDIIEYNNRTNTYNTRKVDKDKVEIEVSTDNKNLENLGDGENFFQQLITRFLAIFGLQ